MARRILIFSLAYLPRTVGGAEIALKEITDRIDTRHTEFHMITNRYDSTLPRVEVVGNVLVHRIGITRRSPTPAELRGFPLHLNKLLYQFYAPLYALMLHRRYGYDGVWAMMAHATGIAVGLFNLFAPHIPFILTLQEGDPPERIERMMVPFWPLFTRAFRRARVVQSISSFLDAWAVRRGASYRVIVPNGIEPGRYSTPLSNEDRHRLRHVLGASPDDMLIVTASRLVSKNGIDILIESLRSLSRDVVLAICGDGPERTKLISLAHSLGVADRVRFVGEVSQEELPRYLMAADCFARISRSEGQGIAFLEAMAAGIPVIGTPVGGIPDFLKDNVTGFMTKSDSPESVSETISYIQHHRDEASRIALAGKEVAQTAYSWNGIAERMSTRVFSLIPFPAPNSYRDEL